LLANFSIYIKNLAFLDDRFYFTSIWFYLFFKKICQKIYTSSVKSIYIY